ncbi:MAG: hypothetical protein Q9208_000257 [Pyrenodesmia sp. 3 TL-2023]
MNLLSPYSHFSIAAQFPSAALVLSTLTLAAALVVFVQWFTSPLRKIPGPWIASLTNIWRLRNGLSGREEMIYMELHEKYGPVVRAGPDLVLVNDPEPLSTIYRWDRGGGLGALLKLSKVSMLSMDSVLKVHDKIKRAFKQPLSISSVLEHEAAIDHLVGDFFRRLGAEHGHGEVCNLSAWIDLLPPDVVTALLWSKPLGLIERGEDVGEVVYGTAKFVSFSIVPLVFSWIPGVLVWMGFSALLPLLLRSVKSISSIIELAKTAVDDTVEGKRGKGRRDILQSLVDYRDHDGNPIPRERLYGEAYGLM